MVRGPLSNIRDRSTIDWYRANKGFPSTEEHILDQFLSSNYQDNLDYYTDPTPFSGFEHMFSQKFQETSGIEDSVKYSICIIDKSLEPSVKLVEISLGKFLYINFELDNSQEQKLLKVLQK